jgi:hypothetical protein
LEGAKLFQMLFRTCNSCSLNVESVKSMLPSNIQTDFTVNFPPSSNTHCHSLWNLGGYNQPIEIWGQNRTIVKFRGSKLHWSLQYCIYVHQGS